MPAGAPKGSRNINEALECTPEAMSLHGEAADAADQFMTWCKEMHNIDDSTLSEDSTLKIAVIESIDEVLVGLGFFTFRQITTEMNSAFVKALLQLDDDVEMGESLLADLRYELQDDEASDDVLGSDDDVSPSVYEVVECVDQDDGIEPSPPLGTDNGQEDDHAKGIEESILAPTEKWMRTEESGNQVNAANFTNFTTWRRLLGSENPLKERKSGDENIATDAHGDGIVPDSQEEQPQEDDFEIPCTQMVDDVEERGQGWASIPVEDGRKVDDRVHAFEETGILSGLHATADCDGFTHSSKYPDKEVKTTRDKDGNERRRSKRLLATQECKQEGSAMATRKKTRGTEEHGKTPRRQSSRRASEMGRSQSSTPKKSRPPTRSANDAVLEKHVPSTRKKKKQCIDSQKSQDNTDLSLPEKFKIPPDQAGCSKCRFTGCRRCRGYTLDEYREYMKQCGAKTSSPKKSQSSLAKKPAKIKTEPFKKPEPKKKVLNILGGIHFLVSVRHSESKDTLTQMIKDMGGDIIERLPTLKQMQTHIKKQSEPGQNHQEIEKVLVATNPTSRTLKCIFARVMGIPIVSEESVYDCQEKGRLGGFRKRNPHVYVEKNAQPVGRIFEDLDILLLTEPDSIFTKDLSVLIQSLGGNLLKSLDSEFGKCDLVLYSDTDTSSEMKAEIGNVERMARRFRIPSHPLSWLTQGIVDGIFKPEIPNKRSTSTPVEIQATLGTTFEETIPAQRPPLHSSGTRDEFDASEAQDSDRNRQNKSKEHNHDNRVRNLYSTLSSFNDIICPWKLEGQLHDPPHGLRKSPIRMYFEKAVSIDETISIGDFVQLLPDPGEQYPKVAKVLGLWRQLGRSGQNRLFGKFQRYYRFNETSIRQMQITKDENTNTVFKTDHIDDNVPLSTVISSCRVEMLQYQVEDTQSQHHTQRDSQDHETLYCTARYDYETGALLALHDG